MVRYTLEWSLKECVLERKVKGQWTSRQLPGDYDLSFDTEVGVSPERFMFEANHHLSSDGICDGQEDAQVEPQKFGPRICRDGHLRLRSTLTVSDLFPEPMTCGFVYDLNPVSTKSEDKGVTEGDSDCNRNIVSTLIYRETTGRWRLRFIKAITVTVHPGSLSTPTPRKRPRTGSLSEATTPTAHPLSVSTPSIEGPHLLASSPLAPTETESRMDRRGADTVNGHKPPWTANSDVSGAVEGGASISAAATPTAHPLSKSTTHSIDSPQPLANSPPASTERESRPARRVEDNVSGHTEPRMGRTNVTSTRAVNGKASVSSATTPILHPLPASTPVLDGPRLPARSPPASAETETGTDRKEGDAIGVNKRARSRSHDVARNLEGEASVSPAAKPTTHTGVARNLEGEASVPTAARTSPHTLSASSTISDNSPLTLARSRNARKRVKIGSSPSGDDSRQALTKSAPPAKKKIGPSTISNESPQRPTESTPAKKTSVVVPQQDDTVSGRIHSRPSLPNYTSLVKDSRTSRHPLALLDEIYEGDVARTIHDDEDRAWLVREEKELTDSTRLFCSTWARFIQEHGTMPSLEPERYLITFFHQYGPLLHHAKASQTVKHHLVRLYRNRHLHEPLYGRRNKKDPDLKQFMQARDRAACESWLRLTRVWNDLVKKWDEHPPDPIPVPIHTLAK